MKSFLAGSAGLAVAASLAFVLALPIAQAAVAAAPGGAIVMVRSYGISALDGSFVEEDQGSGVIIDNQGTVLTAYHVLSPDSPEESILQNRAYQVCITKQDGMAPVCEYNASLVSFDRNLDTALIRMIPAATSYETAADVATLPSIQVAPQSNIDTGGSVTAFGFPSVGGTTLTVTQGTINGREDIGGLKWLKVDALVSFGSSGGALLNKDNQLIGLVNSITNDGYASLGRALDTGSFYDWLQNSLSSWPQASALHDRMNDLTKKQMILNFATTYRNRDSSFFITRPAGWQFEVDGENTVAIFDPSEGDASPVVVMEVKLPYRAARSLAVPLFKKIIPLVGPFLSVASTQEVTINGYKGTLFKAASGNGQLVVYGFPVDDNYIYIFYGASPSDSDSHKAAVNSIINSVSFRTNNLVVKESRQFANANPKMSLKANSDWVLTSRVSSEILVNMYNKKNVEAFGLAYADTITELPNNPTAKQYSDYFSANKKNTTVKTGLKLNSEIRNVVRQDQITYSTSDSAKPVYFQSTYYVRRNNQDYLVLRLAVLTGDKKVYVQAQKSFENMLKTLTIK